MHIYFIAGDPGWVFADTADFRLIEIPGARPELDPETQQTSELVPWIFREGLFADA